MISNPKRDNYKVEEYLKEVLKKANNKQKKILLEDDNILTAI
jgi:hypothetical protein